MKGKKHWAQKAHEIVLARGQNGSFNFTIDGGADNGQFCFVGSAYAEKGQVKSGKLHAYETVLEINSKKVSGYTQNDVVDLIKSSPEPLRLLTVKSSNALPRDLRQYLRSRFQRDSADHELQQTIRDNLYMRTVPCTTREPRPGERQGVDYLFLSVQEFEEMEKRGELLESGLFEGNHYGTPKPSKEFPQPLPSETQHRDDPLQENDNNVGGGAAYPRDNGNPDQLDIPEDLGPLPEGWLVKYAPSSNQPYYIDTSTQTVHWLDPRLTKYQHHTLLDCEEDDLPFHWDVMNDPQAGAYYIDHVHRRTQFENPVAEFRRKERDPYSLSPDEDLASRGVKPPHYLDTPNAREIPLCGEIMRTNLFKGPRGFGFTIVGGDELGEFLQIKSIVPDGPADQNGRLNVGDVLVMVNDYNVLYLSHAEVVDMFSKIPAGSEVYIEARRGYEGAEWNDADPVERQSPPEYPEVSPNSYGHGQRTSIEQESFNKSIPQNEYFEPGPPPSAHPRHNNYNNQPPNNEFTDSPHQQSPEIITTNISKGTMGFGFTIADSSYGQRIRSVMDNQRCRQLKEGDLLLDIDGQNVKNFNHFQLVNMLKSFSIGQYVNITVQRGGLPNEEDDAMQLQPRRQPDNYTDPPDFYQNQNRHESPPMRGGHKPPPHYQQPYQQQQSVQEPPPTSGSGWPSAPNKGNPGFDPEGPPRRGGFQPAAKPDDIDAVPGRTDQNANVITLSLKRRPDGFGFSVSGGQEEGTQVHIGSITPGGAADLDGRLCIGDEIAFVDGANVQKASHQHVIALMQKAGAQGFVSLIVRRHPEAIPPYNRMPDRDRAPPPQQGRNRTPISVTLHRRHEGESFGFVIQSDLGYGNGGSAIGQIVPGSPADRNGLQVGDQLLSVNNRDVRNMHHTEIVNTIKSGGLKCSLRLLPFDNNNSKPDGMHGEEGIPRFDKRGPPSPGYHRGPAPNMNKGDPRYRGPGVDPGFSNDPRPRGPGAPNRFNMPGGPPNRFNSPNYGNPQSPGQPSRFQESHNDPKSPGGPDSDSRIFTVEIQGVHNDHGFLLRKDMDSNPPSIVVSRVTVGSPAMGKLQVGDSVLEVNDFPVREIDDAYRMLRQSGNFIKLLIKRPFSGRLPDTPVRPGSDTNPPWPQANHGYNQQRPGIRAQAGERDSNVEIVVPKPRPMVPHQSDGPARYRPPGGPMRPLNPGARPIGGPGPNVSRPLGPRPGGPGGPGGPRAPLAMPSDAPRPGGPYRPNDSQRRPGPRGPPNNPQYDPHFMPSHAGPPSRYSRPPMSPPGTRPPGPPQQMW